MYHALYVVCMHFSLKPHKTPKKKITDKIKNYVKKKNEYEMQTTSGSTDSY